MADSIAPDLSESRLAVYREEAAAIARLGGAELRRLYESGLSASTKTSGRDLVTEADLSSERVILRYLEERHPEHGWQSEEAGRKDGQSALRWVIDPLDGTANFAHGYPQFSVSVALLNGERSVAGAVYDPLRDECFSAVKGGGATLNGRPLRVSAVADLSGALVSTGFPYEPPARRTAMANLTARAIERVQMMRRGGSAALDLCYVAAGRAEAHWEFYLSLHDVAAGLLLLDEAGGLAEEIRFSDWPLGYLGANGPAIGDAITALTEAHLGPLDRRRARPITDDPA